MHIIRISAIGVFVSLLGVNVLGQPAGITDTPEQAAIRKQLKGQIVFASNRDGNWEIYRMNADGSLQVNLTNHPGQDLYPRWSGDGSKIVFMTNRDYPGSEEPNLIDVYVQEAAKDGYIYLMNADGSGVRKITVGTQPGITPDGRAVAFLRNKQVWVHDLATGEEHSITPALWRASANPCWHPSERTLIFNAKVLGGWTICFVHLGENYRRLSTDILYYCKEVGEGPNRRIERGDPVHGCNAEWSHDGNRISWVIDTKTGSYLNVINRDGTNYHRIPLPKSPEGNDDWNYYPDWSPDDRFIVYSLSPLGTGKWGYTSHDQNLFVTPVEGGPQVQLTAGTAANRDPDWIGP